MVIPPTAACNWRGDHLDFLEDSNLIRTATVAHKRIYFQRYNEDVAPIFTTFEANFQIWSNLLSAIHPPLGTRIRLNVRPEHRRDYDTEYQFTDTRVSVWAAGCVWHYLEPCNNTHARAILLFRGTAKRPATYHGQRGLLNVEPIGAWADGNYRGVSWASFKKIRTEVARWMTQQSRLQRHITFVGFSLGGSLAMRSLNDYATNREFNAFDWRGSELYIFSAPGLDSETANSLRGRFNTDALQSQLHAFWHVDDWVPVTGHYPRLLGRKYSQVREGSRDLEALGFLDIHGLPFVSLEEGWQQMLAYPTDVVGEEPNASGFSRKFAGFVRRFPYGIIGTTIISGGLGVWTLMRKGWSIWNRDPNDWCTHPGH